MNRPWVVAMGFLVCNATLQPAPASPSPQSVLPSFPLRFEPNWGQSQSAARFLARSPWGTAYLFDDGIRLVASPGKPGGSRAPFEAGILFDGAQTQAVLADGPAEGAVRYFRGQSAEGTRVPQYQRARFERVWPGIDVVAYGSGPNLEYDFVVQPGADPRQIRLRPSGGGRWTLNAGGDLLLDTANGAARLKNGRPRIYQMAGGKQIPVQGSYYIDTDGRAGIRVSDYDARRTLTIDPVVTFSSQLGGAAFETALDIDVDSRGFIYLTGYTTSANFPVLGTLTRIPHVQDYWDAFLIKVNPHTRSIVYSVVFGGRYNEYGGGVAVDAQGNAYVAGTTNSDDFPTTAGVLQRNYAGGHTAIDTIVLGDAFLIKFDPAGSRIAFSTFVGTPQKETGTGVALDRNGNPYLLGFTESPAFPVRGPVTVFAGVVDSFLAKIAADGSRIEMSRYVGGRGQEDWAALSLDSQGNIYVAGVTESENFPVTTGAYQTRFGGGSDGYVMKLAPSGETIFSTFIGSRGAERFTGVAVAADGSIWLAGQAASDVFPVTDDAAQKSHAGKDDVVVAKLSADGARLLYATYIGGSGNENATSVGIDGEGRVYLVFSTDSRNLPVTRDAFQNRNNGTSNLAIARLLPASLAAFDHLSYWGSTTTDNAGLGISVDAWGNLYLTGNTESSTFPKVGSIHDGPGGNEVVVVKAVFGTPRLALEQPAINFRMRAGASMSQSVAITSATGPSGYTVSVPASAAAWLTVESTGIAPERLTLRASPGTLAAGTYGANLTLRSSEFAAVSTELRVVLEVEPGVVTPPAEPAVKLAAGGIRNAASYDSSVIAPGLIVTLFGERIGPAVLTGLRLDERGTVATELAGTRVYFDGVAAPVLYASAGQTSVVVPYAVAGKSRVPVVVEYQNVRSAALEVPVAAAAPALFTANASGTGAGAFLNQNGSVNTDANPAEAGTVVTLYATGEGQTMPAGVDGRPAGSELPKPLQPVTVLVDGVQADVLYAGAAPGLVAGLLQVNVRVPASARPGALPVSLAVGSATSQRGVTVFVK